MVILCLGTVKAHRFTLFKLCPLTNIKGVSKGENITIVAVKIIDNECYYAIHKTSAAETELDPFEYKKVKMEELKSEITALNWN